MGNYSQVDILIIEFTDKLIKFDLQPFIFEFSIYLDLESTFQSCTMTLYRHQKPPIEYRVFKTFKASLWFEK